MKLLRTTERPFPVLPISANKMNYTVLRSRRRTMSLEVKKDASVVVHAPLSLPQEAIEQFVSSQEKWLQKALARRIAYNAAHPEPTAEERRALIEKARSDLPRRVAYWSSIMGLNPSGIRITSAKTRFGSCSSRDSLSFSWYLMRYPEAAIDYVVVHELAHIRHHNHSPAFHALVAQYLPDWKERKKLLQ